MPDQGSEKPGGSGLDRDPLAAELGRTAEYEPGSEPTEHRGGAAAGGPGQLEPGSTIGGRFILRRLVARGGMGEVYEAEDTALKTRVALKTLLPGLAEHPESLDRFRREVLLARSVAHPNVCKVFELHSVQIAGDPLHFLTMEFLEGEPLSALMRKRGPLSTSEALPLVRQMAAALDAAHEHGVVHRDFKPSNVILVQQRGRDGSEGVRVVVTDFGIARALSTSRQDLEATGATRTNEFLGTPDYIAPEQVSDKDAISGATDLFALGVVVYQMVTGALPFQGDTPFEIVASRMRDPPRPPISVTRDLGAAWNGAILHCLEKDPSRRPQSAAAVVQELEAVTPVPARRRTRKWLVVAVVLASLLAAIVVGHRLRRPTAVSAVRARPVVAVLPLALEVPPSEAWIGPALSQMVYGQIEEDGGARLIPWWRVLAAYRSLALDTDQLLRPEQRQRVVELLPAQAFVEGQARCASPGNPDQCELRLELKQADGSSQLRTVKNFALGQAADALAGVGTQFREALGQPVRGPPPTAVPASQRPLAVMKAYGEGLTAYARFDFSAARASLEFAASLDPRDFDVQMALSHVLQRQGLFVRARKAAEAALGVAGPVPERHRTVEALLEWLGPDADRGIAAYRKLFEERPDDVELALLLSRRLPVKEALGVLNRVQDLSVPASADLLVNFQEALLTAEENDREKSRTLLASVQARAERLKARRELSLVLGGSDWARAEALSRESGDRQRAAYLQLRRAADWQGEQLRAIGKGLWQGEQLRAIRESLSEFNAIRDATGAHQALVLTALYEDDWQRGRSRLDEALGKLAGTDEPPSFQYHLAAGFVSLRLGELEVARRSLELARVAARRPSLSLFVDIGADFEFPVDLGQLELEVLEQQDRLEEAEALAREQIRLARSAGNTTTEEFLCWSQCQRGKWREGAQCFEQLLAERPTHDRRFRDVAECYWGAGDIERAQRAATMTQNWRIMLATEVVNGEPVDPSIDLQGLLRRTLKGNDVIDRLRNELVLGTAELRYARTSPALFRGSRPLPNGHRLWASGRDRLERVLAEARRRHLPLLERQAREALAKEGQQSPSSHP